MAIYKLREEQEIRMIPATSAGQAGQAGQDTQEAILTLNKDNGEIITLTRSVLEEVAYTLTTNIINELRKKDTNIIYNWGGNTFTRAELIDKITDDFYATNVGANHNAMYFGLAYKQYSQLSIGAFNQGLLTWKDANANWDNRVLDYVYFMGALKDYLSIDLTTIKSRAKSVVESIDSTYAFTHTLNSINDIVLPDVEVDETLSIPQEILNASLGDTYTVKAWEIFLQMIIDENVGDTFTETIVKSDETVAIEALTQSFEDTKWKDVFISSTYDANSGKQSITIDEDTLPNKFMLKLVFDDGLEATNKYHDITKSKFTSDKIYFNNNNAGSIISAGNIEKVNDVFVWQDEYHIELNKSMGDYIDTRNRALTDVIENESASIIQKLEDTKTGYEDTLLVTKISTDATKQIAKILVREVS